MKEKLSKPGQLDIGDTVTCQCGDVYSDYIVSFVLAKGTREEEVFFEGKGNQYFETNMALRGKSWAKDIHFLSR